VTRVVGNRIVIAAGAQDKVKPGDRFKLYPADSADESIADSHGMLTITDVSSNSAQGSLDADAQILSIHPGDWVKSMANP